MCHWNKNVVVTDNDGDLPPSRPSSTLPPLSPYSRFPEYFFTSTNPMLIHAGCRWNFPAVQRVYITFRTNFLTYHSPKERAYMAFSKLTDIRKDFKQNASSISSWNFFSVYSYHVQYKSHNACVREKVVAAIWSSRARWTPLPPQYSRFWITQIAHRYIQLFWTWTTLIWCEQNFSFSSFCEAIYI